MNKISFNADRINNINDNANVNNIKISVVDFGKIQCNGSEELIKQITFQTQQFMEVQIITYGATLTSIKIPSGNDYLVDILLGYDTLEKYLNMENPWLGSIVNFANSMDNIHENAADGDSECLSCVNWDYFIQDTTLFLTRLHGNALITCAVQITNDHSLRICLEATDSCLSHINLAPNLYFNLNGHDSDCRGIYQQRLVVNADKYLTNEDARQQLLPVGGTAFDLRIPHRVGSFLKKADRFGFNHNFVLANDLPEIQYPFACRLSEKDSNVFVEVYTNGNILQLNTANNWPISQHAFLLERPLISVSNLKLKLRTRFLMDKLSRVAWNECESNSSATVEQRDGIIELNQFDLLNDSLSSIYSCPSTVSTISSLECRQCQMERHGDINDVELQEEIINESPIFCHVDEREQRCPNQSSCSDISLIDNGGKDDNGNMPLIGKDGVPYKNHGGIGIAVLQYLSGTSGVFNKNVPVLQPGNVFHHEIIYKFGVDGKLPQ